ncbi:MAG: DUF3795 domain-containing protein [Chloroflexota bacterium]|nr:DUF3795 domain-containing protein [Chloroflexota bacterium]
MEPVLSLCGMRCDLCLAYHPNLVAHPENAQFLSDGWEKYFGFQIPPEQIHCDGCFATGNPTLDDECPVRPCVTERGLADCAACEDYVCKKLEQRLTRFEDIQAKFDAPIPEEDRRLFILPYENADRLKAIRDGQG